MIDRIAREHDPDDPATTASPTSPPPTAPPRISCEEPFDLTPLIYDAIVAYKGQYNGVFDTATFAAAVVRRFDLMKAPDADWCVNVLQGIEWVEPVGGIRAVNMHPLKRVIFRLNRKARQSCG